ncbi:MAG: type II toxin-antitoxin system RelE/ParE family toxin [Bacteroidetes bacterium]|nr:type II toxin-antitoxin system RelE/ParE family toxin [Bacteroidota bacterium]MBU1718193.1 type II toxin-antitoxin system RelE/ParE family toxin [Bacteroidota bacterium]
MKVVFKDTFLYRLESQIEYISLDSPARARKFKSDLFKRIKEIPQRPHSYRKSIYFEDETIRDLIFRGYTIVFRLTEDSIEIFGFVKYQKEPTD